MTWCPWSPGEPAMPPKSSASRLRQRPPHWDPSLLEYYSTEQATRGRPQAPRPRPESLPADVGCSRLAGSCSRPNVSVYLLSKLIEAKPMIKVTVLYPNKPGTHFDMNYYVTQHMPLAMRLLKKGLRKTEVDAGIQG